MFGKWLAALALSVFVFAFLVIPAGASGELVPGLAPASGITITSITPSLSSPQPVGTAITWTAVATGPGPLEYRFTVHHGGSSAVIVQDFSSGNTLDYTDIAEESYSVTVSVQLASAPGTSVSKTSTTFTLTSRVTGKTPVVTKVANPLVALFSGPACANGTMHVNFFPTNNRSNVTSTPDVPCNSLSENVYIAGMYANTTYGMQQIRTVGGVVSKGPAVSFTTGTTTANFPTITETVPLNSNTSTTDKIQFLDTIPINAPFSTATDLSGQILWYYDPSQYANLGSSDEYISHPVSGTVLVVLGDNYTTTETLREIDLAGNLVRQTTVGRVNEQLAALGKQQIDNFSHEAVRFPNGHTLTIGYIEKLFPPGTQGNTGPNQVDVLTDEIIDLNQNFQVDWTWNAFDWLDINRAAPLGETCSIGQGGCPYPGPALAPIANDWTHSNAIVWSPADQDILLSMRNQDWIIKIDYNNATGTGAIVWHLGKDGDFTINDPTNNPYPWFSHQHGIENDIGPSLDRLLTFDDGNTRCVGATTTCDSRGQVYLLDEVNKIATVSLNADLGAYSAALGWAQTLSNGNYSFTNGFLNAPGGGSMGQSIEVQPTSIAGTINYVLQETGVYLYRAYRLTSLYG
jgi:hypothetical protein